MDDSQVQTSLRDGANWAKSLKVGSTFLGTMGEARARGLDGLKAKAFHCGALANLPGVITMCASSNTIASVAGNTSK